MTEASGLGRAYKKAYEFIAGKHPEQRIWHFQWAGVTELHAKLKRIGPGISGRILDVGCGQKPYENWFSAAASYVGIDVDASGSADVLIEQDSPYPFSDGEFDAVVAFEVLEHVENLDHTLREMFRVLRPGGRVLFSVPFLYNEHGAPGDFRRLTKHALGNIVPDLKPSIASTSVETLGGVGSTFSILFLNWLEVSMNRNRFTRLVKGLFLPIWVLISLTVNLIGKLLDMVDGTGSFYHHLYVEYTKVEDPTATPSN